MAVASSSVILLNDGRAQESHILIADADGCGGHAIGDMMQEGRTLYVTGSAQVEGVSLRGRHGDDVGQSATVLIEGVSHGVEQLTSEFRVNLVHDGFP